VADAKPRNDRRLFKASRMLSRVYRVVEGPRTSPPASAPCGGRWPATCEALARVLAPIMRAEQPAGGKLRYALAG
jgi:hypothetical protein